MRGFGLRGGAPLWTLAAATACFGGKDVDGTVADGGPRGGRASCTEAADPGETCECEYGPDGEIVSRNCWSTTHGNAGEGDVCTDGPKSVPGSPADPCPQTGTMCAIVGGKAVACCAGASWAVNGSGTVDCRCELASSPVTCAAGLGRTTCGDGKVDAEMGEQCDPPDFGGMTCTSLGFSGGKLTCNGACLFDWEECAYAVGAPRCIDREKSVPGSPADPCPQTGTMCAVVGGSAVVCCVSGNWALNSRGTVDCRCEQATVPVTCSDAHTCGDGRINPPEQCDGSDLGVATCASLGMGSGDLSCDPMTCRYDTSQCANDTGTLRCTDGAKSVPSGTADPCPQTGTMCAAVGGKAVACCVQGTWELNAFGTVNCVCEQVTTPVTCMASGS